MWYIIVGILLFSLPSGSFFSLCEQCIDALHNVLWNICELLAVNADNQSGTDYLRTGSQ